MIESTSNRGTTRFARALTAVVLVGGLASTLLMHQASKRRHTQEVMRVFAAESESMRNSVIRQRDLFFDVLDSIGQLHELSDQISAEDFEEFSRKGMAFQKGILGVYGFVQRMPHELRAAVEASGSLTLLDPSPQGPLVRSGERPEYFPLVYQHPEDALGFPLGVDLAAIPGIPESIMRMDERRGPALALTLRLQGPDGDIGYFVFSPLYQRAAEQPVFLTGFTASILWPQRLLERALADVATRDVLVYFYDPELHPGVADAAPSGERMGVTSEITVADRVWRFDTRVSPEYWKVRRTALPGVILWSGAAITLLLTMTIGLLAGQTRRIEGMVRERTRELKEANRMLSESMHERMRLEGEILEISEREKQQVGQDLHDSLGQKLTGAVFLSRALAKHLAGEDDEKREQAARINEILKDSVAQVRRMARGLSPVDLGHEGLCGALQRLADETASVYGISCLFHSADETWTPGSKAAHHLYAIALESVNNAIRHGHATEVVVEMSRHEEQGRLIVEDNGSGFDPDTTQRGGLGLRIMQYRATMIGGHFEVSRRPSGGIIVMCLFPAQ